MRFFWLAALLIFVGCGYKPAKLYTKRVVEGGVYTDVKVYLRDPQNAVLIKDAINEAVIEHFGGYIVDKKSAATKIGVRVKHLYFTPLEYNQNGYVIYYRTKIVMEFDVQKGSDRQKIVTSGFYDFPIEPNSVISDTMRFIAIKESAKKAIDRFISRLAYIGAQ